MNTNNLGKRIQELRKLNGITQEELAEKTNLSVRTIQRIENGETDPRNYTLQTIAQALHVEIKDLIENSDQQPQKATTESQNKTWLALLHLSGLFCFLLPSLIIYILKRDEIEGMYKHGADVLNFQISMWIYLFSATLLSVILIGIPILIFLGIYSTIIVVLNSVRVLSGDPYRYPFSIRFIKS
ncbi:MAG: helix-turn-helix domain-containing protein [Bacteroidales bacterium]|nr:helix-turn-helix domain-containing protein [Bacteroidales bacterium]